MLNNGWLKQQLDSAEEEVKGWPSWMRREAGLEKNLANDSKELDTSTLSTTSRRKGKQPTKN